MAKRVYVWNEQLMTVKEIAELEGVPYERTAVRLSQGKTIEQAVKHPVDMHRLNTGTPEWSSLSDSERGDPRDILIGSFEAAMPLPPAGEGSAEEYLGTVGIPLPEEYMRF